MKFEASIEIANQESPGAQLAQLAQLRKFTTLRARARISSEHYNSFLFVKKLILTEEICYFNHGEIRLGSTTQAKLPVLMPVDFKLAPRVHVFENFFQC